jgi:hypothetical protein
MAKPTALSALLRRQPCPQRGASAVADHGAALADAVAEYCYADHDASRRRAALPRAVDAAAEYAAALRAVGTVPEGVADRERATVALAGTLCNLGGRVTTLRALLQTTFRTDFRTE